MDKGKYLDSTLKTYQIAKEQTLLDKYKTKNKVVKDALVRKYGDNIYTPFNSGSYAKNTAINTRFDFDLVAPFKRNAFGSNGTLKDMYNDVYDFLLEEYSDSAEIKKQKVSIGICFDEDDEGDEINIDVVPGREFNMNQYKDDDNLNLYVYKRYGTIDEGSERLKTNIEAQIENIRGRANKEKTTIRKIIRLLKVWKTTKYNYPTKSFFLELITIKAFDSKDINGNTWDCLKTVLEYIRDEVTKDSFSLKDPGNSSNDLIDTLTDTERDTLSNDMKNILNRIEDDDENIRTYFPENDKFSDDDDSYGKKGSSLFSIPTSDERYG